MMAEREKVSGNVSPRPEVPKETGADSDDRRPWIAGAIGKSPHDDALVWRDDAMHGPKFWAATPGDATEAARLLNDLESLAECPPVASDEIAALMADVARLTTELGEARRSLDAIQRATEHPQKDPTP